MRLQVQVMFDSGTADVSALEREDLEEWQREPRKNVLRGENEPLVSLGKDRFSSQASVPPN